MRNSWVSCAALVGAVLGGCQAPADAPADRQADMQVDGQAAAASLCADDGPVFAGTTTCVGRSVNFMDQDALAALPQPRDGCDWAPQETMIGDGEALLFMGAVCKDVPTGFSYDDGKLAYASGDLFVKGQSAVVEVFDTPEDDALAPLRAMIAALPPAEQSGCVIQPYGVDGAPAGAIGIGPTAAARAAAPQDQPNAYCGAYGLNEDESNFWLVRQGKAMFFRLGQEAQDIAPGTMTLMVRDENGDLQPYQARYVVLQTDPDVATASGAAVGVKVGSVETEQIEPMYRYEPGNPLAITDGKWQGYVAYPRVDLNTEFVDALTAVRAYEANVGVMEMTKGMGAQTLKILV